MLKIILFLTFLLPLAIHAQHNLLFLESDTVRITDRTGGTGIDSLDWYHAGNFTLNPGGPWNNPFGNYGSDYLNVLSGFQNHFRPATPLKSRFSALPHLGFMYSFGSKSLQYLHAEYQQAFRKNTHLNIQYNKNTVGLQKGFLRNNSFSNDDFQLLVDHESKRYAGLIYLNFLKSSRGLSDGITTDTMIERFGLEYTPVFKQNANSITRNFQAGSQHALNFSMDSMVRHGIIYKNHLSIRNRVFYEQDTIAGLYNAIYLDSFATADQYQLSRINNSGGYFFKSGKLTAEALIQHGYWRFQNLGYTRDTNEVELQINGKYTLGRLRISNAFAYNLAGARGEWKENLNLFFRQAKWDHSLDILWSQSLPDPFQRQYFANNHSWKIPNLETQGKNAVTYAFRNKSRFDLSGQLGWKQLQNTYFLIGDTWRNDTLPQINLFSASVRGTLQWKALYWQPQVIFSYFPDDFAYIPQFDLRSKLFINKKLFKAKKLDFIIGVDMRYQANYKLLSYNSGLDLYTLPTQPGQEHLAVFELDFFTGFQIDEFRFYIKVENIDYFWNPQTNLQQAGYPVSPNVIRIGLTWDFFN